MSRVGAYHCDRCGDETPISQSRFWYACLLVPKVVGAVIDGIEDVDLCASCIAQFKKFMNGEPTV